jgi:hypothetical protein
MHEGTVEIINVQQPDNEPSKSFELHCMWTVTSFQLAQARNSCPYQASINFLQDQTFYI